MSMYPEDMPDTRQPGKMIKPHTRIFPYEKKPCECCDHCIMDIDYDKLAHILYEEHDGVVPTSDYPNVIEAEFWNQMARRVIRRIGNHLSVRKAMI